MKNKILILLFLFYSFTIFAQEANYKVKVIDINGKEYLLLNFKRFKYDFFICKLRNEMFYLKFSRIRSITFTSPGTEISGYTEAEVELQDNNKSTIYIFTMNEAIEGIEEIFNINLMIPLKEIQSITFE